MAQPSGGNPPRGDAAGGFFVSSARPAEIIPSRDDAAGFGGFWRILYAEGIFVPGRLYGRPGQRVRVVLGRPFVVIPCLNLFVACFTNAALWLKRRAARQTGLCPLDWRDFARRCRIAVGVRRLRPARCG